MTIPVATALNYTLLIAGGLDDVKAEQPPGTDGFMTVLNWITWGVIILGFAGFLVGAGYLAFASYTGREINGFKGIVLAIIVCILAGSAASIIKIFAPGL